MYTQDNKFPLNSLTLPPDHSLPRPRRFQTNCRFLQQLTSFRYSFGIYTTTPKWLASLGWSSITDRYKEACTSPDGPESPDSKQSRLNSSPSLFGLGQHSSFLLSLPMIPQGQQELVIEKIASPLNIYYQQKRLGC